MAGRILTLQRQARELGRLRNGWTDESGDKPRPVKSTTWVVTSYAEGYVEMAAAEWGGRVEEWKPLGGGAAQYRVITEAEAIDCIMPPGDPLSQSYELWSGGGCRLRCDGEREQLSDVPCVCREKFGDEFFTRDKRQVCQPTTRLNVILPQMPDIGVWRMETHSYYSASEIAAHVDMITSQTKGQSLVPIRLRIVPRQVKRDGKTKNFPVVAVELRGATAGQMLAGRLPVAAVDGPAARPALEPARPAGTGAPTDGETGDFLELIRLADTVEAVRYAWEQAKEAAQAGHQVDGEVIGAAAKARAEAIKAQADPMAPPASEQSAIEQMSPRAGQPAESVDVLWQQILQAAGERGLTLPQTEEKFAELSGGLLPADAGPTEMHRFLDWLRSGEAVAS